MKFVIGAHHPLYRYHRDRTALAGRSPAEVHRQWGRAEVVAGVAERGFSAGSFQTVTIRYTVGSMGLDEDGGFKLAFRFVSDAGQLQAADPKADNYISASTNGTADLEVQIEKKGSVRPFQRTVFVHVRNATLQEGDWVDVVLGDVSRRSRGWRQQTYFEKPFPVRFSVDPLGTHEYQTLPFDLGWDIQPGPAARFLIHPPSVVAVGAEFVVRVKAEDEWGNPLRDLSGQEPRLVLRAEGEERTLEIAGEHEAGVWTFAMTLPEPGTYFFGISDNLPSTCNGVLALPTAKMSRFGFYWCDLHGQTAETVGTGTVEEYFRFGRHYGFLDGSVHQGNDFQIGLELWDHIKRASHAAYEPGQFVTFPGYEWSGTEAMGGDHNVIYFEDDPPIYRSTGWLDGNPFEEHAPLPELYRALRPHKAMTIAHIGGRPASLKTNDSEVERLWEIHSAWGTFEWVYQEAFARDIKIGFVCNSDGHKCRPGASYPGAGIFGTLGGLTCVLSETKDREGFWEALSNRRTYGTTGQRILVDCDLNGSPIGADVIASRGTIRARVLGTAPILRIDLLRRGEVISSFAPAEAESPDTLMLRFGGARVKGRARMIRWEGSVEVSGNTLAESRVNGIFSPVYGITGATREGFEFRCATTGNLLNIELAFENGLVGMVRFDSNRTSFDLDLSQVTREPTTIFEAQLDQLVEVSAYRRSELPHYVEHKFDLEFDHSHEEPYFVRVTQVDEGKAWTSPFYVKALE
ncbi:MAG: DUF3604 domain-containing protein [Trueperaceae bacterium]